MKTKKSLLVTLLAIVVACMSMFVFTACGGEEEHVHAWGEWQVDVPATCLAEGKEVRVCKLDASHVENRTTPKSGHSGYVFCGDCGKILTNDEETTYYNTLLDNVISTKTFGLTIEDVAFSFSSIEIHSYDNDYDGIPDEEWTSEMDMQINAQFAELVFGVDQDGKLIGYGDGSATLVGKYMPADAMTATVYFEDNVGYFKLNDWVDVFVKVDATEIMEGVSQMITEENLEQTIDSMVAELKNTLPTEYHQAIDKVVAWIKGDAATDINGFITEYEPTFEKLFAAFVSPLIKKTAVQNGYELSFNYDLLRNLNNALYTKTIEDFLIEEYGINPLVKIRKEIDGILSTTVGEILDDLETELGMTLPQLINAIWEEYTLPDEIAEGLSKSEIVTMLGKDTIRNTTLNSLLQDFVLPELGEGLTVSALLDQTFLMLGETLDYTIYELMFTSVVQPEISGGGVPPYSAAPSQENVMQMVKQTFDDVIDLVESVYNVVIHTNAQGELVKVSYNVDADIQDLIDIFGEIDSYEKLELTAMGKFSLIPNYETQLTEKYTQFKAEAEEFFSKIDLSQEVMLNGLKAQYGEENVTLEDGYYTVVEIDQNPYIYEYNYNYGNDGYTFNREYTYYNYTYTFAERNPSLLTVGKCGDVVEIELISEYSQEIITETYLVTCDNLGNEISVEGISVDTENYDYASGGASFRFGYNVKNKTLSFDDYANDLFIGHDYTEDQSKSTEPEDGLGKVCWVCEKCGKEIYEYFPAED